MVYCMKNNYDFRLTELALVILPEEYFKFSKFCITLVFTTEVVLPW